ncbi:MAG: ATP cone domain-containing protein [Candidatus Saccharimonas sp.]
MGLAIDVVKRSGKRPTEVFDPGKLYASIYASCASVRSLDGHADDTSRRVCDIVIVWCQNKSEVTSDDIRTRAAKALHALHPDAAYLYKHYKQII